jgi:preprotein translocase subunit SecG
METLLLIVHIILAILLIGSVLLQKSDGGALGIGGNSDNLMSSRSAGNFLTKFTALLAFLFIITSISLTLINKKETSQKSIIDKIEQLDKNTNTQPKIPSSK